MSNVEAQQREDEGAFREMILAFDPRLPEKAAAGGRVQRSRLGKVRALEMGREIYFDFYPIRYVVKRYKSRTEYCISDYLAMAIFVVNCCCEMCHFNLAKEQNMFFFSQTCRAIKYNCRFV